MAGLLTMSLDELMGEARRAAIQAKKKVEAVADKGKQLADQQAESSSSLQRRVLTEFAIPSELTQLAAPSGR